MGKVRTRRYKLKDGKKVIIRSAVIDDAEAVQEQTRIILEEDLYNITTAREFPFSVERQRKWIRKRLNNPTRVALVAELDSRIVGILNFGSGSRKRIAHRGSLYMSVHPEFRRRGIGRALLRCLIGWAKENPVIEKVRLSVFANNLPAIDLYRKMKFLGEGLRIREIKIADDEYIDEILMYRFVKK